MPPSRRSRLFFVWMLAGASLTAATGACRGDGDVAMSKEGGAAPSPAEDARTPEAASNVPSDAAPESDAGLPDGQQPTPPCNSSSSRSGTYVAPNLFTKSSWGPPGATVANGQMVWSPLAPLSSDPDALLSVGPNGELYRAMPITPTGSSFVSVTWPFPTGDAGQAVYFFTRFKVTTLPTSNYKFARIKYDNQAGNTAANGVGTMWDPEAGTDGNASAQLGAHCTSLGIEDETRFGLGCFLGKRQSAFVNAGGTVHFEDLLNTVVTLLQRWWMDASYVYAQFWVNGKPITQPAGTATIWFGFPSQFAPPVTWQDGGTGSPSVLRFPRGNTTLYSFSAFELGAQLNTPQTTTGRTEWITAAASTSPLSPCYDP